MKKKIFLWIILVLEAVLFVFLGVLNSYPDLKSQIPFNGFYLVSGYYYDSIKILMQLTHFDVLLERMFGEVYPNLFIFISLVVVNLLFIGVYYLIFGPITISLNKKKEKEIREIVKPYELSNSEYEKFNYKNYLGNFPIKRIISLIIPLLFIALFVLVRFDRQLCSDTNSNIHGIIEVSNKAIEPAIGNFLKPFDVHKCIVDLFHNASGTGYVDLVNKFLSAAPWVEYGIIVVISVVLLALWFGLFSLINLMIKKPVAKRKANNARERYIKKMENIEYKLHSKYKEETNIKAEDFMHVIEKEQNDAAKEIALYRKEKETEEQIQTKDNEQKRLSYYEEIGQGVSDLGVSELSTGNSKPITEREVKYISDEEVDIILDEEPVIEIVESDEEDPLEVGKNDIFYERYQPDDVEIEKVEEYSGMEYGVKSLFEDKDVVNPIFNNTKEDTNSTTEEEQDEVLDGTENDTIQLPNDNQDVEEEKSEEVKTSDDENKENEDSDNVQSSECIAEQDEVVEAPSNEEEKSEELIEEDNIQQEDDNLQENNEVHDEEVIQDEVDEEQISVDPIEAEGNDDQNDSLIEESIAEEIKESSDASNDDSVHQEEEISEKETSIEIEESLIDSSKEDVQEQLEQKEAPMNVDDEIIEVSEEDIIEEKPKKKTFADFINKKRTSSPQPKQSEFTKYINRRNAPGYGAKRVPTFKQIEEQKNKNEK